MKMTDEYLKASKWLNEMDCVIGIQLINPDSIYYGRAGHERFARECGYALNDFSESVRHDIISQTYGKLYVKHCDLKPILDNREWVNLMLSQIKDRS